jgi:hypothetical protein
MDDTIAWPLPGGAKSSIENATKCDINLFI